MIAEVWLPYSRCPGIRANKFVALVSLLCFLLCSVSAPADVGSDVRNQATSLFNTLNPINLALGPLIDRAAQDGDAILQQRLEQLHGIIQEALLTLDGILKNRIEQLDQNVKNRLDQLQVATNGAIQQLNALATDQIHTIDDAMQARIDQLGNATGNVLASLPIPIEPIINVGPRGMTIYKQKGDFTTVFITGSGLRKNDSDPEAWLEKQPGAAKPFFSMSTPGEFPVVVSSASMGLIQVKIPNNLITSGMGSADYALKFKLRRGNTYVVIPSYTYPSVPVRICSGLPPYQVHIEQTASGEVWERRTIPVPGAQPTKGLPNGFYVDSGEKNKIVCAVASEGYEVDSDPYPGYNGGLHYDQEGGDHYHNLHWTPGCVHLYADDRDGGANEWIAGVVERQRKKKDANICSPPVVYDKRLEYGSNNKILLDPNKALGPCAESGLSKSPQLSTKIEVQDANGKTIDLFIITQNNVPQFSLGGALRMQLDASGLLSMQLNPTCRWQYDPVVAEASRGPK